MSISKKIMIIGASLLLIFSIVRAQTITVIGQPDATTNAPGHNADRLNFPLGIAVDAQGGLYVADRNNHRVLYFANDGDAKADRVYGQHSKLDSYIVNYDGQGGSGQPSADTLSSPTYAALDSAGGLYVADRDNHRVLYYAPGDTTADRVYGQFGSFTLSVVNNDGSGQLSGVGSPGPDNLGVYALTIALDPKDGLYIADSSNHRVLYYAPREGDTTADRVYGQFGSLFTGVKNNDGKGGGVLVSADSLNFPRGIAFDTAGGIYMADRDNHRVLYFGPDGDTTADRVYGQFGNMAWNTPNNNGSGPQGTPSAQNLFSPRALVMDGAGGLYVADSGNNRVLYFAADGDTTADWVFGQAGSFSTGVANNDGKGAAGKPSAENLSGVQGLALHNGKLYISDTNNNRILIVSAAK
jgi:hypothetical protein